jgi:hypothetical protein
MKDKIVLVVNEKKQELREEIYSVCESHKQVDLHGFQLKKLV